MNVIPPAVVTNARSSFRAAARGSHDYAFSLHVPAGVTSATAAATSITLALRGVTLLEAPAPGAFDADGDFRMQDMLGLAPIRYDAVIQGSFSAPRTDAGTVAVLEAIQHLSNLQDAWDRAAS